MLLRPGCWRHAGKIQVAMQLTVPLGTQRAQEAMDPGAGWEADQTWGPFQEEAATRLGLRKSRVLSGSERMKWVAMRRPFQVRSRERVRVGRKALSALSQG